jgi:hypothetical protein
VAVTIDQALNRNILRIRASDWPDPASYLRLSKENGDARFYPDAWSSPSEVIPFRALTGSYGWEEYRGPAEKENT